MKILLAADSYKECLTAHEVCEAMKRGVLSVDPTITAVTLPMADGGDGTLEVVLESCEGSCISLEVTGPLGEPVEAEYGWLASERTAIIEAATANGLHLVPASRRDPMKLTTQGVGELLLAAIAKGAERVVITVGGSATVEGGTGLARALGYRLLDAAGQEIADGGRGLQALARIEVPEQRPWEQVTIEVACDVDNPLTGPEGAARVFGPQKGATAAQVESLDQGLANLAQRVRAHLGCEIETLAGAGAAGGLSAGIVAFAGGVLRPGIDLVMQLVDFEAALQGAQLVITGEGKTDAQTFRGKVCAGVARAAARQGIPCVVIAGAVTAPIEQLRELGIHAAWSICRGPITLDEAMARAAELVQESAANAVSLFLTGRRT